MREWTWLIVPLVALLLFLLSQVLNKDRQQVEQRRPQRRPGGELQRFLEEVRQLRQAKEPEPKLGEPVPLYVPPPPPPPVVQQRPEVRRTVAVPVLVGREVLDVLPANEPSAPPQGVSPKPAAALTVAPLVTPSRVAPAVRRLVALLRDPRSLATAVLLKEVLDRPLAVRRRR
jgi:hypothetical protein